MAKGDAAELRADLDDGYARVSNTLIEALCLADVTLSAVKSVLFVVRRTYGWAKGRDHAYKTDTITAQEIADGTGMKLQTVRDALRDLRNKRILIQVPGAVGGPCAYGVNPDISEWGAGDSAWDGFRARFKDAHDAGAYRRNGTVLDEQHPIGTPTPPLLPESHPPCDHSHTPPVTTPTGVPAEIPCGPCPEAVPTDSSTDSTTKEECALKEEPAEQREETPLQAAANACLAVWGLTHKDLTGAQCGKYYPAMAKIAEPLEDGFDELTRWAEQQGNGTRRLKVGGKPETAIPRVVRGEVGAAVQQRIFDAARKTSSSTGSRVIDPYAELGV